MDAEERYEKNDIKNDGESEGENLQSFQSEAEPKGKLRQKTHVGERWRDFAIKVLSNARLLSSFSETVVAGTAMWEPPLVSTFRGHC